MSLNVCGNTTLKTLIMLKSILNLKNTQTLSKEAQRSVNGGAIGEANCPRYSPQECQECEGYSQSNGCCLGSRETHICLRGIFR